MYLEYYNLKEFPFLLTPDHRFFFESATHRRAMANLVFGLEQAEGFIVLTGEVGCGKTTLLDHLLLDILDPAAYVTGKIVSTHLQADDMLRAVAACFQLPYEGLDKASVLRHIQDFLVKSHGEGKRVLLVIDEAQNVPPPALEELRMLSNFQVGHRVPLQSVMLAQPQFRRVLATPDLDQFRQRIIASYHLSSLSAAETGDYIRHRMAFVGWTGNPSLTPDAVTEIFTVTGGTPRKINSFCTRLLLHAYLDQTNSIEVGLVRSVFQEMSEESQSLEAAPTESGGIMQDPAALGMVVGNLPNAAIAGLEGIEKRLAKMEKMVERHAKAILFLTTQSTLGLDPDKDE